MKPLSIGEWSSGGGGSYSPTTSPTSAISDVSDIGHFGTGDLEVTLKTMADFEKVQPLMLRSYEGA